MDVPFIYYVKGFSSLYQGRNGMEDLSGSFNNNNGHGSSYTRGQLRTHKIVLTGRKACTITGVNDVLSFDINEVLLETEQGMLMIKGSELHVSRLSLDKGEVDVDGSVDSLTYSDTSGAREKTESFFARLFQ